MKIFLFWKFYKKSQVSRSIDDDFVEKNYFYHDKLNLKRVTDLV